MSIGSQYFETKAGYPTYHFDKIDSREMCHKIADECRSNASFERMKSIACVIAALVTAYLEFLAFATIASNYGLFTRVVSIIALTFFALSGLAFILPAALAIGFVKCWKGADHYSQQAHLADLRAIEISQEVKKSAHTTKTGSDPIELEHSET